MDVTIIGAGAIGGVLGAYLIKEGHQVELIDIDTDHVRAINTTGLHIEGPEEVWSVRCRALTPTEWVTDPKPLQTILLCVKAQHTKEALEPFLPYIDSGTQIVSLQNGLCEKVIADLVDPEQTIGCFVNFSADYLGPGRILYGGIAALYIGELDGTMTNRILELQKLLSCWGPVQVTNQIWGYLWGKMSYAGLLYATALVDETMANVVRKTEYRDTLMELCSEILEVAECEGVRAHGFDDWEPALVYPRETRDPKVLDQQLEQLAERMATNKKTKSGIWRDLAVRKRRTEIDAQLLPIIEIGKKYQRLMPLTNELVSMIHGLEEGSLSMSWSNLDQLKGTYESCVER